MLKSRDFTHWRGDRHEIEALGKEAKDILSTTGPESTE
jgi:hypothetical protein